MKFKRGDRVKIIHHENFWAKFFSNKGTVGVVFEHKAEVTLDGNFYGQPFGNSQIELIPIYNTEIFKALTEGEYEI